METLPLAFARDLASQRLRDGRRYRRGIDTQHEAQFRELDDVEAAAVALDLADPLLRVKVGAIAEAMGPLAVGLRGYRSPTNTCGRECERVLWAG